MIEFIFFIAGGICGYVFVHYLLEREKQKNSAEELAKFKELFDVLINTAEELRERNNEGVWVDDEKRI